MSSADANSNGPSGVATSTEEDFTVLVQKRSSGIAAHDFPIIVRERRRISGVHFQRQRGDLEFGASRGRHKIDARKVETQRVKPEIPEFGWIGLSIDHDIDLLSYVRPGLPHLVPLHHIERCDHVAGVVRESQPPGRSILLCPGRASRAASVTVTVMVVEAGAGWTRELSSLLCACRGSLANSTIPTAERTRTAPRLSKQPPGEWERDHFRFSGDVLKIRWMRGAYIAARQPRAPDRTEVP